MRLTLRTLLAYLDGNLEADDSKDIAKKIEESEFATKLVHLIRDCTGRLRLGAPALVGRALAADPNSVAEYLEYQLPDERVPEFEKICLESEIHLAEVASCHQILTLVLGEPAEIAPESRQRLYALAAQADAPPALETPKTAAQAPAPPAALPPAPPVVRRPKPEVPEYLRDSRWRWWPVAALVLLAATLTFGGLLVFGPAQLRQRVTALVRSPAPDAESQPAAEPATEPAGDSNEATDSDSPPADETAPAPNPPAGAPAHSAVVVPEKPLDEDPDARPAPAPPEPGAREPLAPAEAKPTDLPAEPRPDEPPAPAPETPPAKVPDKAPGPGAPTEPAAADVPREPPAGFGRFTSKREVLLRFDPGSGDWVRLPATSPLNKGDRLLSLPSFRPTITLSSNITIQADGPALFELVGWTDEGVPILAVEFGRLLMLTVGRANNSLQLNVGTHRPILTFVDAESTLAIEVRRDLPPGQDPQAAPLPESARLFATSGLIRVRDEGDEAPVELQAPAMRSLVRAADSEADDAAFPTWVTSEEQSDTDRLAAGKVDGYLDTAKPAGLQLRELADPQHTRQREVRSLAIRALMYLGDFDPCVAAMNRENERFFWPDGMDELRAAVARSPETAARVRTAFENRRGAEDGGALYRIVWGYRPAQLTDGADRQLIEALASDSLDFRVMSFETLKMLTGATHGYRPDDQEVKRRAAYNTWKKQIGRIVPRDERSKGH
jgi:hypothetical protein